MAQSEVISTPSEKKRASRFFGQYIIKTRFQLKFSLVVFAFLAVASLLIWLEGKWAVEYMVKTGAVQSEEAVAQLKLLNSIVGKTTVLGLAVTFGLSLFFSHFLAGPIYRFEKTLEEMREGNLNVHVKLRKHDELKDMADLFNQALSSLRNKTRKEREALYASLDKASELADKLRKAGRASEADELQKLVDEVKSIPPQIHI